MKSFHAITRNFLGDAKTFSYTISIRDTLDITPQIISAVAPLRPENFPSFVIFVKNHILHFKIDPTTHQTIIFEQCNIFKNVYNISAGSVTINKPR